MPDRIINRYTKNNLQSLYLLFAVTFAAAVLFHIHSTPPYMARFEYGAVDKYNLFIWMQIFASLALLMRPQEVTGLIIVCIVHMIEAAYKYPFVANHHVMTTFLCLAVLFSYLHLAIKKRSFKVDSVDLYLLFAPHARWLLVIMYFYGTFHKINEDFLIPEVSCAVELFKQVPIFPEFITESRFMQHISIWGTLILEAAAMIMLFMPKYKYYGIMLGLSFHFIIGISEFATISHFSALCFALHMLFLSPDAIAKWKKTKFYKDVFDGNYATFLFWVIPFFIAPAFYFGMGPDQPMVRFIWTVYAIAVMVFVGIFSRSTVTYPKYFFSSPLLINNILTALFIFNGLTPYIGLKTQYSISMFSNLHTEGRVSNHLIITKPLYLTNYQNDLIKFNNATDMGIWENYIKSDKQITAFEFKRFAKYIPTASLEIERNGKPEKIDYLANHEEFMAGNNPILEKLLRFKPVDWKRPKECSH